MNQLMQFINDLGRVPVIPLIGFPGVQLIGKSIKHALTDAQAQTDALLALYDAVRPDALFAMMDLTVEAQYLGCDLKFAEDDQPSVSGSLLDNKTTIQEIFANKTTGGRMPLFAEVVKNLKAALDVPVCAYVIGPLTLAGQIMDITRLMKATRKNPDLLHQLLFNTSQIIMNYAALLEKAGADLICILEPSAMMISNTLFDEFSGQYCKTIISNSISRMSVLHICGDTNHIIKAMEKVGADGLSLDKQVELPKIHGALQTETVLIGNIDPVSVVTLGDPALVKQKSRALLDAMATKANFILSTGCDVPSNAPIENIQAMMTA